MRAVGRPGCAGAVGQKTVALPVGIHHPQFGCAIIAFGIDPSARVDHPGAVRRELRVAGGLQLPVHLQIQVASRCWSAAPGEVRNEEKDCERRSAQQGKSTSGSNRHEGGAEWRAWWRGEIECTAPAAQTPFSPAQCKPVVPHLPASVWVNRWFPGKGYLPGRYPQIPSDCDAALPRLLRRQLLNPPTDAAYVSVLPVDTLCYGTFA